MNTLVPVLLLTSFANGSGAQDPLPTARRMAAEVRQMLEQMDELAEGEPDAERKRLGEALEAVVKRMQAGPGTLTLDHYVEVSSVLLVAERLADCTRVCHAGLERHPDARFLYDHLGYASLIEGAEQRTPGGRSQKLAAAEAAFQKALTLEPKTHHTHAGLFQVLSELDRPAEAIAQLDLVLADAKGKASLENAHVRRGGLLLRAGRLEEAIAELEGPARAEDEQGSRILALRARAMASGPSGAKQAADLVAALLKDDASPAATAAAADVLFHLGRKDDAAKLLGRRPVVAAADEDDSEVAVRKQSHEALGVMVRSKELAGEPLRLALTKALDHHFVFLGKEKDKDGEPKPTDYASSPLCMSSLLKDVPRGPKTWANQILLALCLKALAGYRPPADERAFTDLLRKNDPGRFPDAPSYLPMVLAAMRRGVADPEDAGALIALRVAEKLEEQKGKPAKK